jgi:hypothetical protein
MEGMSEREYSAHSGLSRGGSRRRASAGRLVVYSDGSINAAASDVRRAEMTDPDQQRRSTGGDSGFQRPRRQLVLSEGPHGADGLPGAGQAAGDPEEEGHAGRPRAGGNAGVPPGPAGTRCLGHLARTGGGADGGEVIAEVERQTGAPVTIEAAILQRVLEAHVRQQLDALADLRVSLG